MIENEETLKSIFSYNLKRLMEEQKKIEITVSSDTKISQSAINRIKNGQVTPTLYQAIKLADFFMKPLEEFIKPLPTNIDNNNDKIRYAPVLNSHILLKEGRRVISGFIDMDDNVATEAFKFDESFSCGVLNPLSIFIVRKNEGKFTNGTMVLFSQKEKYKIGTIHNKNIIPVDDMSTTVNLSEESVSVIGEILKIETSYIKEKTAIEKIISCLGRDKLIDLGYAFS